ncbi:MAG: MotA/TolQ/ExbB proton channel family protein [Planctomycetales bacterium]|nr:MotA/TolQ/ExbB proton channel family protein [Planctomycetales bacterium]
MMQFAANPRLKLAMYVGAVMLALAVLYSVPRGPEARAQSSGSSADGGPSATPAPTGSAGAAEEQPAAAKHSKSIDILALAMAGGIFMIPILGMSILAATMTIERFIGLRKGRVLPEGLVTGLGSLGGAQGTFDPRKAYRLCQQYPSAAANVIRAMLLKVGRPISEIETTATQASQREADKLYANVKWINMSAGVSTMLGLIGTIQGMILAFHQMTVMEQGVDRTSILAGGIYTALVTTFAGLAVAIPCALFSHYFEGRIQSLFHQIDELVFSLLPQLERYEGRVRFSRQGADDNGSVVEEKQPVAVPR